MLRTSDTLGELSMAPREDRLDCVSGLAALADEHGRAEHHSVERGEGPARLSPR
jgi:hypothetical protein